MRARDREILLRLNKEVVWLFVTGSVVVATLVVLFLLRTPPSYYEYDGFTLGTYCRIYVSSEKINPKSLAEMLFTELDRIYKKYNANDPESVLSKINVSQDWVDLDEETFVLLDAALKFSNMTEGAFDPTLGNLIHLWGFDQLDEQDVRVPDSSEIEVALLHTGYKNILLDRQKRRAKLLNGIHIDLGGIAKGYALDRVYQIAKEVDPDCTGFVEAGGDIRIIGPKFGSRSWVIGIRDPDDTNECVGYLYLDSGAVATSGDYERYFIVNGVRYHHILDPQTGYPARGIKSATVVASTAVTADALSTAAFVLGGKNWEYVVLDFPKSGGHVLLVDKDRNIRKSPSLSVYEADR